MKIRHCLSHDSCMFAIFRDNHTTSAGHKFMLDIFVMDFVNKTSILMPSILNSLSALFLVFTIHILRPIPACLFVVQPTLYVTQSSLYVLQPTLYVVQPSICCQTISLCRPIISLCYPIVYLLSSYLHVVQQSLYVLQPTISLP